MRRHCLLIALLTGIIFVLAYSNSPDGWQSSVVAWSGFVVTFLGILAGVYWPPAR